MWPPVFPCGRTFDRYLLNHHEQKRLMKFSKGGEGANYFLNVKKGLRSEWTVLNDINTWDNGRKVIKRTHTYTLTHLSIFSLAFFSSCRKRKAILRWGGTGCWYKQLLIIAIGKGQKKNKLQEWNSLYKWHLHGHPVLSVTMPQVNKVYW